jgi:hypothetical protein
VWLKLTILCACTAVWELYTGEKLFHESISIGQVFYMIAYEGWRPQVPPGCPSGYVRLMTACWATDPEQRPSACDVLDYLNQLYAAEKQQVQQGRQEQDLAQLRSLQQQQQGVRVSTEAAAAGAITTAVPLAVPNADAQNIPTVNKQQQQPQQGTSFGAKGEQVDLLSEGTIAGDGGVNTTASGWVNTSTEDDSSVMTSWEGEQAGKAGGMHGVGGWNVARGGGPGVAKLEDRGGADLVQNSVTGGPAATAEERAGDLGAQAAVAAVARREAAASAAALDHAQAKLVPGSPLVQEHTAPAACGLTSSEAASSRQIDRDLSTSSTVSTGTLPRTMASGSAGAPIGAMTTVSTGSLPPTVASLTSSNRNSSTSTAAEGSSAMSKEVSRVCSTSGDVGLVSDQSRVWASSTAGRGSMPLGSMPEGSQSLEDVPQALPGAAREPLLSPFADPAAHAGGAGGVKAALRGGSDESQGMQQGRTGEGHGRTGEGPERPGEVVAQGNASDAAAGAITPVEGGGVRSPLTAFSPFAAMADRAGSLFAPL